jgi:hypothetical protein
MIAALAAFLAQANNLDRSAAPPYGHPRHLPALAVIFRDDCRFCK